MPNRKKATFSTAQTRQALADAAKEAPQAVQTQLDIKLSPYQAHSDTLLHSSENSTGTYHRSGKHEQMKSKETEAGAENGIYTQHKKSLSRDKRAHAGAYNNNFQRFGDLAWDKKQKKAAKTSEGNSDLYNHLIHYRQIACGDIAGQLTELKHIKVNYHQEYPCLMIHIEKSTTLTQPRKPSDSTLEAWTGFLLNYFIGAMNASICKSGIRIEMIRRASFGFLSPTVAPTGECIRLNIGIIPVAYQSLIVETLKTMDNMLGQLKTTIADKLPLPNDHFFKSEAFKQYHLTPKPAKKSKDNEADADVPMEVDDNKPTDTPAETKTESKQPIDNLSAVKNLFQLLWTPVDKSKQTTLQNIMRTAHAQSGIQKIVFQTLTSEQGNPMDAMCKAIQWATGQFTITKGSLSFSQAEDLSFAIPFTQVEPIDISGDDFFWACIKHIHENVSHLPNPMAALKMTLNEVETAIDEKNLFQLYAKLDAMDDAIMIQAGCTSTALEPEDGFGSDSENEADIEGSTIYSKKIIVGNGMRAIICALIGASLEKKSVDVFVDNPYYEVPDALKLVGNLNNIPLKIAPRPSEACIRLTDATPCITNNKQQKKKKLKSKEQEYLNNATMIIDTTSASIELMQKHVKTFTKSRSPLLCFAASGTKQEQLGGDSNSYGTLRFFSREKRKIEAIERKIHEIEEPIRSPTSHQLRRSMKAVGAVPTTKAILKGP
ncbi:MAG TPA: hypothetical protein VFU82_02050 [Gammaproteobacteria bacterium]|jgi:hypothetical protein|nr:hypothetical protein [Gammaproteobacteria bacterium]